MTFLEKLGGRWNIDLFHYRDHRARFGRVLAGFEVPPEDSEAFQPSSMASAPLSARARELSVRVPPWRRSRRRLRSQRDQNEGTVTETPRTGSSRQSLPLAPRSAVGWAQSDAIENTDAIRAVLSIAPDCAHPDARRRPACQQLCTSRGIGQRRLCCESGSIRVNP